MQRAILIVVLVALPTLARAEVAAEPATVYLRHDGGTLTAGWDDSASDVSSLVARVAGSDGEGAVRIPAWRGGARRWKQVAACVRTRFAPFAIEVVETRPTSGDYIMVMVGGSPDLLGYTTQVSGVAPYSGERIANAVSYVFSENLAQDAEATCVGILHEAGHALGLDHAYLCEDPMSYLYGCGKKTFQDVDAPCGEADERDCGNGEATQNSYRQLAASVGLRGDRDEPDPDPEPAPARDAEPAPDADGAAPSIALAAATLDTSDGDDHILTLTARAASRRGIADVVLLWSSADRHDAVPCSAVPDDFPATCTRRGDTFTFRLRVGTGEREVAAVAVDRTGVHTVTDPRWLFLDD